MYKVHSLQKIPATSEICLPGYEIMRPDRKGCYGIAKAFCKLVADGVVVPTVCGSDSEYLLAALEVISRPKEKDIELHVHKLQIVNRSDENLASYPTLH